MIEGLNPRKLVYRDGTSQSQRLMHAPDPDSIAIEERSLQDFLQFAARFAQYLNFYNEENAVTGNWSAFLNGGLPESANQQKWFQGLINYAENPDQFISFHQGTPFSSPHLALFITFLKLLENIKLQVNDFTRKHLDLYYEELLGIDKKKPMPDVVNVIVQLTADVEKLLIPEGTQLLAGKDSSGKDLIYETKKDTLISQAAVKNIKSLFIDKNIIGLDEKRQKYFDRMQVFKEVVNMALGYDTFPKLSNDDLSATAISYLLKDTELSFLIKSAELSEELTDWTRIYQTLESAYRRLLIRSQQEAKNIPLSLFSILQTALGDEHGRLPDFNNSKVDAAMLERLYKLSEKKTDTSDKTLATDYITNKLMLSVTEFSDLAANLKEKIITDLTWREIYVLLERARSKRKDLVLAVPQETEWEDIIAVENVKTDDAQLEHFKTFGHALSTCAINNQQLSLGMAISSPRLLMREGKRNIDVYIAFDAIDKLKTGQLADAINKRKKLPAPFLFYISTNKGWKKLTEKTLSFGDFLRPVTGKPMPDFSIKDGILTAIAKISPAATVGEYVLLQDGSVYRIDQIIDANSAQVSLKAKMPNQQAVKRYTSSELCLNAIYVRFELSESDPEIVAPDLSDNTIKVRHHEPVLALMLNTSEQQSTKANGFNTWYQKFSELTIAHIRVDVEVNELKAIHIQNEYAEYSSKKPFSPFGNDPGTGKQLYISHPEVAAKVIDSLTLTFNWVNAPKSFATYYGAYRHVFADDMGGLNREITQNGNFTAELSLVDHDLSFVQNEIPLFNNKDASLENKVSTTIKWPALGAADLTEQQLNSDDEVINWTRYFVLELKQDFKQSAYPVLITRQALNYTELKGFVLNPPYLPVLKQLTLGYQAAIDIPLDGTESTGKMFHITPFGYAEPIGDAFMPPFENEGELYIGLTGLGTQQNLSLLFQLATGSANPDMQKPDVKWSYLEKNRWVNFTRQSIISDTTNGLLTTGLLELAIPPGLSNTNSLMGHGLYWLRASVHNRTAAIPDLVNVIAQGISAVFTNHHHTEEHLEDGLKPYSIQFAVGMLPGVKTLEQPFASMDGKASESMPQYYARVSERLRHKNRALTMWDYERLVLEAFTEIYKVKCLPGNFSGTMQDTGNVDVIVIPRIQGRPSFNSFQPKLHAETLLHISDYLEARIPPFVTVTVKNPTYVQLRVRTAVRIKEGYPEAYYLEKLENELKKLLAPWAYDEQAEIVIGGSIHHNVIVNFIAERPYIDHVNTIKLLQSRDGIKFRDVLDKEIVGEVSIVDPNVILVSASSHEIRLLTEEEEFSETFTEGIGYMAVDVDFKINANSI